MLGKLLKHEFRATGRVMGPLYLIVLATAVGGNLSVRLMDSSDSTPLNIFSGLLMTAFVVAIIGVCVMSLVLMVQRFHKNLMGDEGYIMFTLPASVHQHIWSKIIVSSVWFVATGAIIFLAMLVIVYDVGFMGQLFHALRTVMENITAYYALNGAAICAESLVLVLLGCAVCCLQFYAAMSIGHSFPNHKIALSVVFFFVLQFAVQLAGSFLVAGLDGLDWSWPNFNLTGMPGIHVMMGILCGATVLYGAIFYIITAIMLKKRLNLE